MATKKAPKKPAAPAEPTKKKAKPITHVVADNLAAPDAPPTPPVVEKPLVNHIVFCLDDSGSCKPLQNKGAIAAHA